ncbi:MAG: hypothetical protein WC485_10040, partial [Opitutaceae bacterium]
VTLQPGESRWVPVIISAADEGVLQAVNARGFLSWLLESQRYYRGMLGRLRTPAEPYLAEFYERSVMQGLQCLAESGTGAIVGGSWGGYATRLNWTKDIYHSALPFMTLDPALGEKVIAWFDLHGVRPVRTALRELPETKTLELPGGVSHSVGLSVAAPLLAGVLYDHTGDAGPFLRHPEWKANWARVLDAVLATRRDPDIWLVPTHFVSDGAVLADYHTGSNVCLWRALSGYARLLGEVWKDAPGAKRYGAAAAKVKAALLEKTVVAGPAGRQFIEATWRDGRPPTMESDGEESDTTLMPYFGFLPYDDEAYLNYMQFSMSAANPRFTPELGSLTWESSIPSTAPGYSKGLCAGLDRESLFGDQGFFTNLRRVTDADGCLWWWPYGSGAFTRSKPGRAAYLYVGKSGWSASVNALLISSRFLGVSYDAPRREFRFAPLAATGDFTWQDLPMGNEHFDVAYTRTPSGARAIINNRNEHALTLEATLPVAGLKPPFIVTVNGRPENGVRAVKSYGQDAIHVSCPVGARKTVELEIDHATPASTDVGAN